MGRKDRYAQVVVRVAVEAREQREVRSISALVDRALNMNDSTDRKGRSENTGT